MKFFQVQPHGWILFCWFFLATFSAALGQQLHKVTASDAEAFDRFGSAVALDGDRAVIGAPWDSSVASSILFHGSIYIFELEGATWAEKAKLVPATVDSGDYFGSSVAVSGDIVAAGSPWDGDAASGQLFQGSVHVFEGGGANWTGVRVTAGPATSERDFFGDSVAVDGDRMVVGAPADQGRSGAAYIFERTAPNTWSAPVQLLPSTLGDRLFGDAVSIEGNTVAVGSRGAVYVFENLSGSWAEVARLAHTDPGFGESVALSADRLSVGASGDELDVAGALHIYEKQNGAWIAASTQTGGGLPGDFFAEATAHLGRLSLAGAPGQGNDAGAAELFTRDAAGAWNQGTTLTPADSSPGQYFGEAVAISERAALIGAPGDATQGSTAGAAYFFAVPTVVQFTGTPTSGSVPLTVTFTDLSTTSAGARREWDFGDGTTLSTSSAVASHTYLQGGNFTVTLDVHDGFFSGTEVRQNFIQVVTAPVAAFVADVVTGTAPLTVTFTDQSTGGVTTRDWDFGDGESTTTSSTTTEHTYVSAGTYTVSLTVTGPGGQDTLTRVDYIDVTAPAVAAIQNGGFEANGSNIIGLGTVAEGNPIDSWEDFGVVVGRNVQGDPFYNNGVTSDPDNVCFLKNDSRIEQTIPHLEAGVPYRLSLEANARAITAQPWMQVELGGTILIDEPVDPVNFFQVYTQSFRTYSAIFVPSSTGSHTLKIRQTRTVDATLLIDSVKIEAVPHVKNGGFEANGSAINGVGTVAQGNPIDDWNDFGIAGRNVEGGPFFNNGVTTDPENVAFLKNVARLEQTLSNFQAGTTYSISLRVNARSQFAKPILKVELGGTVLISNEVISPVDPFRVHAKDFDLYTWTFTPTVLGDHKLVIHQTKAADATLLIDDVTITVVP